MGIKNCELTTINPNCFFNFLFFFLFQQLIYSDVIFFKSDFEIIGL